MAGRGISEFCDDDDDDDGNDDDHDGPGDFGPALRADWNVALYWGLAKGNAD